MQTSQTLYLWKIWTEPVFNALWIISVLINTNRDVKLSSQVGSNLKIGVDFFRRLHRHQQEQLIFFFLVFAQVETLAFSFSKVISFLKKNKTEQNKASQKSEAAR